MADNPERRKFLKMGAGLGLAVGAKMLGISTAYAAQSVDCPIYMFHAVSPGGAAVDRVIRENARIGRRSVSIRQLSEILLGEREVPDYPIFSLTFDDGLKNQFDNALPVLNKYEAEATFFVMGGTMDGSWRGDGVHQYMSPEQTQHLSALGYEIGSHSVTHRDLVRDVYNLGKYGEVGNEVRESKEKLESVIETDVVSFAYPNGSNNPFIRQAVAETYQAAVSSSPGRIQSESIEYMLRRIRA